MHADFSHGFLNFFGKKKPHIFKLVTNTQKTNLAFDISLICWLENTSRLVKFDDSMKQNKFKFSFPYIAYLERALRLKILDWP